MTVKEIIELMDKDDKIGVCDHAAPIDSMDLYQGEVSGLYYDKDNPVNKMHVVSIAAFEDELLIFTQEEPV